MTQAKKTWAKMTRAKTVEGTIAQAKMTRAKPISATPYRAAGARACVAAVSLLLLAACEDGAGLPFLQAKDSSAAAVPASNRTKLVERDVESPDVFQVTEAGLWDGRPSLGGVWVAHPDAQDPERVIIRNSANGKFVIGALFRREREIPGPRIQASSDAAAALGMLAGAPVELNVTALRREAAPEEVAPDAVDVAETDTQEAPPAPSAVSETALDPIAGAAAAIEASAPPPAPQATAAAAPTKPPKQRVSPLDKPFIQIGIFSVEANAERTAGQMRNAGMIPTVYEQSSNGKPFWRVLVGPAYSKSERSQLLKSVKATGFSDAYAVTN
ncbi:SPOR domain-containing protein [Phaeobacter sp. PT47_59]|uniref:SPOR domain-containing protein n=2 Tax=Phaeobacter sp. PT47_59 TaxID=3029979 RepID=UPI0023808750|nr:SPOR domain-containing protein [Phaeobacter sp. PT47_59]MDE4176506.1 SPOR domain-containing protein [Phaeobacter sp. PT47_59]